MNSQTKIYKKWPPHRRLQAAAQLYQFAKEIIRTREKNRNPELTEQELEKQVRSFFR